MSLFYVPNLAAAHVLPEEESQHAVKVLRLQAGDAITVVDGVGGFYNARITNPHHKHCAFEVIEALLEFGKRDYKLHIAIAPTKNIERLEWFIEKATEIGIDEITPIICRFSERKIVKEERLEKIIVSAAKQSLKAYFPKLNSLCTFDELMKNHQASQKFIAHCYEEDKKLLQNEIQKSSDVLILIGPEGDFSKEEVQKAISLGFIPVSLGNSRLRTETAGVVACHTAAIVNQF
ncbi:MAG TPA: 16S rRNA (uracil(1498)-N(3))-methyltransferase [Paludibacter sp.]|nr:16S rRNA (uracil(1498)-N(3))-methyltransferase [Paludibacter sp.]